MRTDSLLLVSALLMSAAVPAFAQSHQEEIICRMAADNCLHEQQSPGKAIIVASTFPESMETMEQREKDIRDRLHGSAYVRAEIKSDEVGFLQTAETLEQKQDNLRKHLHGDASK